MRKKLIILFLSAFVFRIILAFVNWHPDLNNHVDWGIRFWQYGPGDFYSQNVWSFSWPNQPPGTILIFAAIRKLFEFIFAGFWWLNVTIGFFPSNIMLFFEERLYQALLKLPAILADLGIAYLIFWFFKKRQKDKIGLWGANAFLINPVTWYNSAVWGQTDATVNFFSFFALLLIIEKKLILSLALFFISLFIKLSLAIIAPILLIVAWQQKHKTGNWVKAFFIPLVIIGLVSLPFANGEPFSWLFNIYKDKVLGWQLHIITANAFNLWAFLTGIHERPDIQMFGPLNFKIWGYILFILALIPLVKRLLKDITERTILWVAMLTVFSSFVLLTGMHERYLYPLFPLLTIIAAFERRWLWTLVSLSAIHLINLYNFWWYPRIEALIDILSAWDRLLPRVLGAITTVVFIWLYFQFFRKKTEA